MKAIAHIENGYSSKFGIPRQSGIAETAEALIVFEPTYRNPDAVRGLEAFSHIWLLWEFSQSKREEWSPMVRPPRLGGNKKMGVFATRSPFRPNPIGLSSVRLVKIEHTKERGPVLHVVGADLLNGTPIYDIKPYLKFTDCHTDATDGFTEQYSDYKLSVDIDDKFKQVIGEELSVELVSILKSDPRPSYQNDSERVYGMEFSGYEVKFTVDGTYLKVTDIFKNN